MRANPEVKNFMNKAFKSGIHGALSTNNTFVPENNILPPPRNFTDMISINALAIKCII